MDWRFLLILVILLVFTNWLGKRWVFHRATLAGTDILLQQPKPVPAVHCTLITINEQEFDAYLGEWLRPEQEMIYYYASLNRQTSQSSFKSRPELVETRSNNSSDL